MANSEVFFEFQIYYRILSLCGIKYLGFEFNSLTHVPGRHFAK